MKKETNNKSSLAKKPTKELEKLLEFTLAYDEHDSDLTINLIIQELLTRDDISKEDIKGMAKDEKSKEKLEKAFETLNIDLIKSLKKKVNSLHEATRESYLENVIEYLTDSIEKQFCIEISDVLKTYGIDKQQFDRCYEIAQERFNKTPAGQNRYAKNTPLQKSFDVLNISSSIDKIQKSRGPALKIGQVNRSGTEIKTADGYVPVKGNEHLIGKEEKKQLTEPSKETQYNSFDKLKQFVIDGKIIITRNGLLGQDLITLDNKLKLETKRIGGGFTQGHNVYTIINEGKEILKTDSLKDAYNKFYEEYVKSAEKPSKKDVSEEVERLAQEDIEKYKGGAIPLNLQKYLKQKYKDQKPQSEFMSVHGTKVKIYGKEGKWNAVNYQGVEGVVLIDDDELKKIKLRDVETPTESKQASLESMSNHELFASMQKDDKNKNEYVKELFKRAREKSSKVRTLDDALNVLRLNIQKAFDILQIDNVITS